MKKMKFVGIIALVMIIGLIFAACDTGAGGGTDSALNGTWILGMGEAGFYEFTFNNGSLEQSANGETPYIRATYTTSGGSITIKLTAYYQGGIWLTKAELLDMGMPEENVNQMFATQTASYSISGNTLTMTTEGQTPITYTRK
jgi:predicted small secreted protein